jgi:hypothetical protein
VRYNTFDCSRFATRNDCPNMHGLVPPNVHGSGRKKAVTIDSGGAAANRAATHVSEGLSLIEGPVCVFRVKAD